MCITTYSLEIRDIVDILTLAWKCYCLKMLFFKFMSNFYNGIKVFQLDKFVNCLFFFYFCASFCVGSYIYDCTCTQNDYYNVPHKLGFVNLFTTVSWSKS